MDLVWDTQIFIISAMVTISVFFLLLIPVRRDEHCNTYTYKIPIWVNIPLSTFWGGLSYGVMLGLHGL